MPRLSLFLMMLQSISYTYCTPTHINVLPDDVISSRIASIVFLGRSVSVIICMQICLSFELTNRTLLNYEDSDIKINRQ